MADRVFALATPSGDAELNPSTANKFWMAKTETFGPAADDVKEHSDDTVGTDAFLARIHFRDASNAAGAPTPTMRAPMTKNSAIRQ